MKKIFLYLLLSCLSLTTFGQVGFWLNNVKRNVPIEESSVEISDVDFDFDPIYYYEIENITLTATPNVGVSNASWTIRDMETDMLVGLYYGNEASITTVDVIGWYRITYEAVTDTDRIKYQWDDILILDRRFAREEADVIVNMASGNYYNDFASADNTGLKVWVENSGTGYCYLGNLWGSPGFENYVRIQAGDDGFIHSGVAGSTGIGLSGGRYIIVDGHYPDKSIGAWENRQPTNGTFDVRLGPEVPFTNIIFTGIKINRQGYTDNAAFSLISGYSQTWNALTWVVTGMAVHHCWIENAGAEAIYSGFTDDRIFSGSPDFQPVKSIGYIVAWNTIINAGNDAIQLCNSIDHRVHNNYINGVGTATNQFHETVFSDNAGSSGWFYNNIAKNAKMFATIDSGLCPGCNLYAGDSTVRGTDYFNNVLVIGTFQGGGVTENGAIYVQTRVGYKGAAEWPLRFWNNVMVTSESKELMNIYFASGGLTIPNFKMVNNIVVSNDTGGDYQEVDFIGPGTQPTSETVNNLFYTHGNEGVVLFTDTANLNYRPSSLSSTAFAGSPEDISVLILDRPLFDADGAEMDGYYGAYSRMDLKIVDPTPTDTDPAIFSTALSVENETTTGGDIEFESDKEGLLYWAIVANDAAAPTIPQLIAGGYGITSGNIVGALAPSMGSLSGLSAGTAYDLYAVFVTTSYVPQASATKVDFTTTF